MSAGPFVPAVRLQPPTSAAISIPARGNERDSDIATNLAYLILRMAETRTLYDMATVKREDRPGG
jgi:hypothetical protein